MTPERWKLVKDVLGAALARPPDARGSLLERACGDDADLRREVEELLACEGSIGSFLNAPLVDTADEDLGVPDDLRNWTRYEVLELLGRGGMAAVYRARDPRLHRLVAIKVIAGADAVTVQRFLREAEAQARVEHDHVLKVYETGVVGHLHYIAMQHVNGPTLMGIRHETTIERKVQLVEQIAEGLYAAHRQGLVHRDIKPSNILVEERPDGLRAYLLDFGLAAEVGAPGLTKSNAFIGTPRYMSPERIRGGTRVVDRRSDIYSLGATFYELLCGEAPYSSDSDLDVLTKIVEGEFTPLRKRDPGIPAELEAIIGKCLESDPDDRYPSARALADDLRRYLDGEPVEARHTGAVARVARRARKHPRLTAAFAALAVLAITAASWAVYGSWRATRQAQLAERLGREVRDLEWLYRAAQMSPLHPIDAQKQEVRRRMKGVEQTMAEVGTIGYGPGHYALGRGYLTLGDYATARQHLELAWNAGYQTPDTATTLGLVHGEIFRVELERAQRLASDRDRTERIRAIEVAHRDQALSFLEQGHASTLVPNAYRDALIASHRGNTDGAIARANQATVETPWLFEAPLFSAHLRFAEAVRHYVEGDLEGAARSADEAGRFYADAQRVAPSAIDARLGRCAIAGLVLHIVMHGLARDFQSDYEQAEDSCQRAMTIEPLNAEAYRLQGEAVRSWAGIKVQAGEDPGTSYERAIDLARHAVELSGGDVDAVASLADTVLDRAWWQSKSDVDPRTAVDQAVAGYERVLAVDARNIAAVDNMAQAFVLRGRFEVAHGFDATTSLDKAVQNFMRAIAIDPSFTVGYRGLARTALSRAQEQTRRGIDPRPALEGVLQFIDQSKGERDHPTRLEARAQIVASLAAK